MVNGKSFEDFMTHNRWVIVCDSDERMENLKLLKPSNIAFGGPDGKTAYVTLQDMGWVETFEVDRPGRSWQMRSRSILSENNFQLKFPVKLFSSFRSHTRQNRENDQNEENDENAENSFDQVSILSLLLIQIFL